MTVESTIASLLESNAQLDELSKQTLGKYRDKANWMGKESERYAGVIQAKADKEKFGSDKEAALSADAAKLGADAAKRRAGVAKADKRLIVGKKNEAESSEAIDDETSEQLDELSAAKLVAYRAKADAEHKDMSVPSRQATKRYLGVQDADKRIRAKTGTYTPGKLALMKDKYFPKRNEELDVSEAVDALFNGEDGLTEEFRAKAETIFESAVSSRITEEVAHITEQLEQAYSDALDEAVAGQVEDLVEHVDGYLNLMVGQWMEHNEVAIEAGMQADILESFVGGMKNLFQEHYIEVPEDKFDLVEDLETQLDNVRAKLSESVAMNIDLAKVLDQSTRQNIVAEACAGLSDLDAEKLRNLSEEIAFEDGELFAGKLQTIRENYFSRGNKSATRNQLFLNESATPTEKHVPADMRAYVNTIATLSR